MRTSLSGFSRCGRGPRHRLHQLTVANLLRPFHDDAVAWSNTLFDRPKRAYSVAHFHRPDLNLILSSHHRYFVTCLQLVYGTLWNQECPWNVTNRDADADKPARTQNIVRIRK